MINLMLGDCLERMKEIPDGSVDMVLADPPYGTTACKWDSVIPFEPMWEQLNRIIKPNGAIVLFVGLKLTGYIAWSWVWVTSPIWISFILAFLIIFFALLSKEKKKVSRLR